MGQSVTSSASADPAAGRGRFPGFDVLDQAGHWDPATAGVVLSRIGRQPEIRFFTPDEQAAAIALCDQLLDQAADRPDEPRVPVVNMIDARLAENETDGWRYQDMPEDGTAWRDSLAALDEDANARFGGDFASCSREHQATLIQFVQDRGSDLWHGMQAAHVWSLWTRYACTAFYAHPTAWNEIGFPGPAYPRGYKNPGVDGREPFEVRDARPAEDPVSGGAD
ncbi:MAG TPA: gluconate 2-dehydrogenase subunit 3 family protein [Actinocrinis sp.]|nr:gluconate 2-dehydrogenase subunit 3 family protein [Actinocrinis sp.]